jgi:sulfate transport system ATP-binding protein
MQPRSTAIGTGRTRQAQQDHFLVRAALLLIATAIVVVLIIIPLINVFYEALAKGPGTYWSNLVDDPDTRHAILLTLTVAPLAVMANLVFGIAAAWAIARFRFPGRTLLTTLIDLPFSVSPVVAGLIFILIFGLQGYLGPWLREHDIKIIFATPGLILATAFVTFPFVARELIPLMEAFGAEEELAAVSLGARGWQMFWRVTLPNIKWGLLYGVILCNARAMGEFGAVYVVSGHIAGQTDTMPLRVEKLFQEYNTPGSFAVASVLTSLALLTLLVKTALEWKTRQEIAGRRRDAVADGEETVMSEPSTAAPLRLVSPRRPPPEPGQRDDRAGTGVGISVKNITKRFGNFVALDDVTLDVPHGSLLALLGPSGSGKTTLLRIIAGLEVADGGSIHYQDEDATHRSPRDRNVGFVFQHYALFRHMTVFENVAFGLRVRRWKDAKIRERVSELLGLVQLESLGGQLPSQLSGGQRQRVALARALAAEPKVLLLDEPFGALDAKVRQELRQWLRRLHDEIHVTSVFVTHDQEEAFEVADKVVVMNRGRVEQAGTPEEVFEHPANAFVMDFLGNVNVFHGRVEGGRALLDTFDVDYPDYTQGESRPAAVYVRPHELEIDRVPRGRSTLKAEILRINPARSAVKVELISKDFGLNVTVELAQERYAELQLKTGDTVYVFPKRVRVFVQEYSI